MCWKLLLGLFAGYNNNNHIPMRQYTVFMVGKNTELGFLSTYNKYSYYDKDVNDKDKYCGFDKRTNNLYDNDSNLILNISQYFEMAKHVKTMQSFYTDNSFEFIENDENVATILHDFFDYNSIQPMRINNGGLKNNGLLYDW